MGSDASHTAKTPPCKLAVFDLDGTCINGQSGKLISTWLLRHGHLSLATARGLMWWGIRYKLHLPQKQERSRELIFNDINKYDPQHIDRIMVDFHNEVMVPRYRARAQQEIRSLKEQGYVVLLVSATFEAIAREAARYLGADGYIATQMERDERGRYTGYVLGDVIEGTAKVRAVKEWANERYGVHGWNLLRAYGDHSSDAELLGLAKHPVAVSPGLLLRRLARANGWPIENWKSA